MITDQPIEDEPEGGEHLVIEQERIRLTARDSLLVHNLLENPPSANAKLRAAIATLPFNLVRGADR